MSPGSLWPRSAWTTRQRTHSALSPRVCEVSSREVLEEACVREDAADRPAKGAEIAAGMDVARTGGRRAARNHGLAHRTRRVVVLVDLLAHQPRGTHRCGSRQLCRGSDQPLLVARCCDKSG